MLTLLTLNLLSTLGGPDDLMVLTKQKQVHGWIPTGNLCLPSLYTVDCKIKAKGSKDKYL